MLSTHTAQLSLFDVLVLPPRPSIHHLSFVLFATSSFLPSFLPSFLACSDPNRSIPCVSFHHTTTDLLEPSAICHLPSIYHNLLSHPPSHSSQSDSVCRRLGASQCHRRRHRRHRAREEKGMRLGFWVIALSCAVRCRVGWLDWVGRSELANKRMNEQRDGETDSWTDGRWVGGWSSSSRTVGKYITGSRCRASARGRGRVGELLSISPTVPIPFLLCFPFLPPNPPYLPHKLTRMGG
ncbi:hypothetical protein IWX47DRAFT_870426 [Phyllosticta citricarpa]